LYEPYLLRISDKKVKAGNILKINPENIELIKKGLVSVVADDKGTGRMARSDIVSIAGKTGTSQVIGGVAKEEKLPDKYKDHAWFIAFASQETPLIAVAVFVEHGGHGGTGAAPIAKRIIEAFYKKNQKSKQRQNDG
jgi:penicillin-binding protein 2